MHTFLVHIANYWITDKLGFDTDKLGIFPNNTEHFGTFSKKPCWQPYWKPCC